MGRFLSSTSKNDRIRGLTIELLRSYISEAKKTSRKKQGDGEQNPRLLFPKEKIFRPLNKGIFLSRRTGSPHSSMMARLEKTAEK